jgi:glycosyltransferase involved in cell wall biosynthesis
MRIALYNLTTTTKFGGVESFVWDLARELAGRDHQVTVIGGVGTRREAAPGVRVISFPFVSRSFWQAIPPLRRAYAEAKLLERLTMAVSALPHLAMAGYDIIHIQKPYDLGPALLARRLGGAKVILGCHGEDFYRGDTWLARMVDASVSCSRFNAATIQSRYGFAPQVVFNGIDIGLFRPVEPDLVLRRELSAHKGADQGAHKGADQGAHKGADQGAHKGAPSGAHKGAPSGAHKGAPSGAHKGAPSGAHKGAPSGAHKGAPSGAHKGAPSGAHKGAPSGAHKGAPLLLFVGRLQPWKGVETALRALPHISGATLLIAGDGEDRVRLEQIVADLALGSRVHFLGGVERRELPRLYSSVDLLLATSHASETFGIGPVEAQACGLPVVASRFGGFPEVVDEGRTGLLVPARDPEALAVAVNQLLADPARRAAMAAAAPAWAAQFAWPAVVDRIEALYRQIQGG